jgi:tripartite-type tricarboxylate transporter receptor subunit TctC
MQTRRQFLQIAGAAMGAATSAQAARPLDYPNRPVRIIVPFLPGGTSDIFGRIAAQRLSDLFGKYFYVENIGGDGGYMAAAQARRAPPDGYTVLFTPSSFVTNLAFKGKAPYDPVKDFAPVTAPVASAFTVVVHPLLEARTLDELITFIKTNPGRYNYASGGAGAQPHLTFERFRRSLGLDIAHVSFGGGRQAIASVVAGRIPICIISLPNCIPHIQEGSLRALMVSSRARSQKLPDVPTAEEAGYPMLTGDQWQGVLAPAGTPPEVIAVLHSSIAGIITLEDVRERLLALDFYEIQSTPEEFAERIRSELQSWRAFVEEAQLRPG